ncbi:MAG: glycosyltransferase family 2 protein [Ilumatobacteraceae bacterium]|jgi:hypothetical protein|nr:glycosyltransferase family 2 protein [Ilumatobacteraceae bacterium]
MTVAAVSMVRDEADIVEATVRHMLTQVDVVILADNGSVDGTREVLERLPVHLLDDPERGYYQSEKMTRLAHLARSEYGADWVVPFDADEWWYSPHGRISDVLEDGFGAWPVVTAELYDHVATGVDAPELSPVHSMGWRRREPAPLPKVACRTAPDLVIEQGNHGARYDAPAPQTSGLVVRHFPYRSAEQFARKAVNGAEAYAATDLPEDVGRHWREYGRIAAECGVEALHDVFRRWFWVAEPSDDLIFDPVP